MEFTDIKDPTRILYSADKALIVYKKNEMPTSTIYDNTPNVFVTVHSIRNGIVCEGKPISQKALLNLCKIVIPSLTSNLDYLPDKVIAYSSVSNHIVWWMPAGIKTLFFEKSMGIKSGRAPVPPLLFVFKDKTIKIYAMKQNIRPTPKTDIYHTPFFNDTCMGNVSIPNKIKPQDIHKIEELFFNSEFTTDNPPVLKKTTGIKLWKSLINKNIATFPLNYLVKTGRLEDILSENY